MEFCENGELFNRIVEKKYLTEDEAALFYYQLINGLEYIHKNNIVDFTKKRHPDFGYFRLPLIFMPRCIFYATMSLYRSRFRISIMQA